MASNDQLAMIRTKLEQTLSPYAEQRQEAEEYFKSLSTQPNYVLSLLQVLENSNERQEIRLAAVLLFKNTIRLKWDPEAPSGPLPDNERAVVKQHIVELMCRMPESLQKQLIEALSTIGEYDFPHNWPNLLGELVQKLQTEREWTVRNGVLRTANTLFKRFRNVFKSDELFIELKHCLEVFQEPLLQLYKETGVALRAQGVSKEEQVQMVMALRTMSRIFYSLNWQDLPEYFEDHQGEWMNEFLSYFSYENAALTDKDNEDEPDQIDLLLVAIIENINLYAEKYDEEFKPYLQKFTEVTWNLLAHRVSLQPKHDELAAKCMKFLTSVCTRAYNRQLFESSQVLSELCAIVVTNLQLRSSDEELFEDNPMDYIRRDIEGSDGDSRRSAARDLIRGLLTNFADQVTQICMSNTQSQLQQYKADPAGKWALKDVTINLVIALSALKQSKLRGVSEVNSRVPLMDFFLSEVLPELQSTGQASPILKADAIKFVSTFRCQLPSDALDQLFPLLLNCMDPQQFVVHTYAAACVERLLTVKDEGGKLRFGKQKLQPYLSKVLEHVFSVLEQPNYPENDYLMKMVMRVITVAQEDILPITDTVVTHLTTLLNRICANPSNPSFSHYLFEALSCLILNVSRANASATERFEELLFPPFQTVLTKDVEALSPYVYQVFAQLLELRPSGVSQAYMSLFPVLLTPNLWDKVSNIPAIVKLLEAYMRKAPTDVAQSIRGLLGVFQKLVTMKSTERFGLSLLRALVGSLPQEAYASDLREVVKILMMRLQTRMKGRDTAVFCRDLVHTLSVVIGKVGIGELLASMEALQQGMTVMFFSNIWLKNVTGVRGTIDKKACVIALVKLMTESDLCTANVDNFAAALAAAVTLLEESEQAPSTLKDADDALEELEERGYEAGFAKLYFASSVGTQDYLAEYPPAKQFLAEKLATLSASQPGKFSGAAQANLTAEQLKSLQGYFMQTSQTFQ